MDEPSTPGNPTREAQAAAVLGDYLDRRARGEPVEEADILRAHPHLADVLRSHFETVRGLQTLDQSLGTLVGAGVLTRSRDPQYLATLGPYKITGLVGRGGMGIVLRAYDESLRRTVALKILRPELAHDATALGRFQREARAAAALRHPNIITVYAVGQERSVHYIAMEYVDGPSLADVIREEGPPDAATARRIFRELLEGLAAAHDAGLIHRDIKSSNVLLDGPDRHVKIADFGLARMLSSQTRLTLTDSTLGTAEYMSPEQARGDEHIDHRTDLYSAGVVLYELLTGRTPFKAASPSAVIHCILYEDPPDPRKLAASADPHLSSLALRLMAKLPDDRFPATADAIAALDADERIRSLAARRRLRRRAVTAACSVLTLVVAVWLVAHFALRHPPITEVRRDPKNDTNVQVRYGQGGAWMPFHEFPPAAEEVTAALPVDAGDETRVCVVCGLGKAIEGYALFGFDAEGLEVWRADLSVDHQWPDCAPPADFSCILIEAFDLDGRSGEELIVVASDERQYPTYVAVVDPRDGTTRSRLWHQGDICQLFVEPEGLGRGKPAVVALGLNNKLDGFDEPREDDPAPLCDYEWVPVVMILDPSSWKGDLVLAPPMVPHRTNLAWELPAAYAFLDFPPGPAVPDMAAGRRDPRWPETEDTVYIACMRPVTCPKTRDGLCIELSMERNDAQKSGALMIVDENLEPCSVMPVATERLGRTAEYWREHWHPVIQRGRYVGQ